MLGFLGINVVFKFDNTIKNILIKFSPNNNSNLIYEIPCQDCNKVYIGQTSKELETRIRQHKSYVNNQRSNSALFLHSFNNDHNIAWRNSKKILNCNNFHERNIIESFLIGNKINTLNISPGIFSPDPILKSLLRVDLGHLLA